jgi:hypothetical protein
MAQRRRTPEIYKCILTFIREYKQFHGRSPLQREIGAACGLSSRTLQLCLEKLVRDGKLKHYPCMHRGFELVEGAQRGD